MRNLTILKNIMNNSFKIYIFFLLFMMILDFSILVNVFDIEPGYFNIILSEAILLPFNLVYIVIPYIFVLIFLFSVKISFELKVIIWSIICKENIKKHLLVSKKFIIKLCKYLNKFISYKICKCIYLLLSFFYIYYILNLFFNMSIQYFYEKFNLENVFINFFILIMLHFIILEIILSFFYSYQYVNKKTKLLFKVLIYAILFFLFMKYYYEHNNSNYITVLLYIIYHTMLNIYDGNYFSIINKSSLDKNISYKIVSIFIMVIVFFIIIDSNNIEKWKKPIKINDKNKSFLNDTYSLVFNRGFLLNNKEVIKVEILTTYLNYLDKTTKEYLEKNSLEKNDLKINYELKDNTQYLQINNNLKIYFQTIKIKEDEYQTIVFIIREEKEKIKLIELSDYYLENKGIKR